MEEAEREIARGECCTMEELCKDLGIDFPPSDSAGTA